MASVMAYPDFLVAALCDRPSPLAIVSGWVVVAVAVELSWNCRFYSFDMPINVKSLPKVLLPFKRIESIMSTM